jgi:c-di-GMP-binding flagellar brake protein YcgR
MSSPNFAQRRKNPRVDVEWPVTMMTPEGDMEGTIENISAGGAYIRCGTLLSKNDLFILAILVQDREGSWLGAEVVWVDIPLSPDAEAIPIGMGIRFTNLKEEDLLFLTEAVARHS